MNEKIKALLEHLENNSNNETKLKKIYYRPTKLRSIIGFIITLIFMLILLFIIGFQLNLIYMILFIGDFLLIVYYSMNLFTKDGLLIQKYVEDKTNNDKYQTK